MQKGRAYLTGVILAIIGGTGLVGIQMDSDVLFWIYAVTFSIGIGFCLAGYEE